jgi:HlyD family secretion protein
VEPPTLADDIRRLSRWLRAAVGALIVVGGQVLPPRAHVRRWPEERARSIAIWAGFAGAGASIGPIVSGGLLEGFWWGSTLLVMIPVAAAVMLAVWLYAPHSRDDTHTPLDPVGALLSLVGLSALIFGIIQAFIILRVTAPQMSPVFTALSPEDSAAIVKDLERSRELRRRDLVAQSELDTAQTAYDGAVAQVEVNKAQVAQAKAALNQAMVDLNNTIIRSPVDGIVISRNVDVGQTVAASLQAPTLFTIANDLSQMEVHTNVDEADVGNVREGQEVTFTVDAYPARRFRGKVYQVRNAPTVVQNVVTYAAVVRIDNKELLLKPGMTANVQFLVSRRENVLTIPNMALRFRPPDERSEAQDLLRREQSRAAPTLGAKRTSRTGASGNGGGSGGRRVRIYLVRDAKAQPVEVQLGITDGSRTEVIGGELNENDSVIIAMGVGAQAQSGVVNPFQPAQPRGFGFR